MSAQIENNQLAYVAVNGAPWHGLGKPVELGATGEEMLVAAGLNWPVQCRRLAMRGVTERVLDSGVRILAVDTTRGMLTDQLNGFRAVVRGDNDHVFQIASDSYQLVQNLEVVNFFKEFCEAGHATMETVGALRDGAVVWALAKLNTGAAFSITDARGDATGDELESFMLLATSHDGSLKTTGVPTQERVVCRNTLMAALRNGDAVKTFSLTHRSKFDDAAKSKAMRVMEMARHQLADTNDLANQLARVTIDHDGWLEFMSKLMGGMDAVIDPKTADLTKTARDIQDATMTSPGSGLASARGTLWGAVNGVTYYVDHQARSRSDQNRLFSAWFGNGSERKTAAVKAAVELAGIGSY